MKNNFKKLSALLLALALSVSLSSAAFAADLSENEALQKAYEAFDVKAEDVQLLEVKKDYNDGRVVYEIEFAKGYDAKYSCEVVVSDGKVVDRDTDISRNIFDRIELFFEVLLAKLFSKK